MIASIEIKDETIKVDLSQGMDLSIPVVDGAAGPSAWYVSPPEIKPVMTEQFTGEVNLGGSVNFRNIFFNPHGHGTHTECVGHISKEKYSVNACLKQAFHLAQLISIKPDKLGNGDQIITLKQLQKIGLEKNISAYIIRTLPNSNAKKVKQYSDTNPPYVEKEAMAWLVKNGIDHFLIDLPSVDREVDGGELASHHCFWEYPEKPNLERTITEFVFVDDEIKDGRYLMHLSFAPFENDASPSRPVIYSINPSN